MKKRSKGKNSLANEVRNEKGDRVHEYHRKSSRTRRLEIGYNVLMKLTSISKMLVET